VQRKNLSGRDHIVIMDDRENRDFDKENLVWSRED